MFYKLIPKLRAALPEYALRFASVAQYGAEIATINSFLHFAVSLRPDGLILQWDSDVSNNDLDSMSKRQRLSIKNDYRDNLQWLISNVTGSNISMIAISGPTILGESWYGLPSKWWSANLWLDQFVTITRDVAGQNNVPYINMKQRLLEAASKNSNNKYCGYLTFDGQHPIEAGTEIIVHNFAAYIREWLVQRNVSTIHNYNNKFVKPE